MNEKKCFIVDTFNPDLKKSNESIIVNNDEINSKKWQKNKLPDDQKSGLYRRVKSNSPSNDNHMENFEVEQDQILDCTKPFPIQHFYPNESDYLTFRAIFIGCFLGTIVTACNMYLGFKTGFSISSSILSSILNFIIIKTFSQKLPSIFGHKYFGPKENVIAQTITTSIDIPSVIYTSAIPSMYHLNIFQKNSINNIWQLTTLLFFSTYYGLFLAIGFRKLHILRMKLIFSSQTALAFTIWALHYGGNSTESIAKKKVRYLLVSLSISLIWKIFSQYAPGILLDWHIFWWLYSLWKSSFLIGASNWLWYLELTPAFFGVGILTGLNVSLSFWFGGVVAWGIIGPILVKTKVAFGKTPFPSYPEIQSYTYLGTMDNSTNVSSRYWNLWLGIIIMLSTSFTEMMICIPYICSKLKITFEGNLSKIPFIGKFFNNEGRFFADEPIEDPIPKNEQVSLRTWLLGLIIFTMFLFFILIFQYKISISLTILSIVLSFFLSLITIQSAGATDIIPISNCSRATQLLVGKIAYNQELSHDKVLKVNIISAIVSTVTVLSSTAMTSDLKVGYLLSVSCKSQLIAHIIGPFISIWICTCIFLLFARTYRCILDPDLSLNCHFGMPLVSSWKAISQTVTMKKSIPPYSTATSIVFGLLSIISVIIKYFFVHKKYSIYIPNMNAFGIGFTLPYTCYSTAMVVGSVISYIWKKRNQKTWELYSFSIAVGMILGESLGGIINALIHITGISGIKYGSSFGCPANYYCG